MIFSHVAQGNDIIKIRTKVVLGIQEWLTEQWRIA